MSCLVIGDGGHASVIRSFLRNAPDGYFVIAIGDNATRRRLYLATLPQAAPFSPRSFAAVTDHTAMLGKGVQILHHVVVNAGAVIGDNVIINTGAIIEHDCIVGAHSHIAPGAILTGGVRIGEGVLVGAGAVLLPGVTIGDWAVVGAGSVVTKDVAAGAVVKGNPAR